MHPRTALVPGVLALTLAALVAGCENSSGGGTTSSSGATTTASADGGSAADEDIGEVLATVNGLQVGSKEFETQAARKSPAEGDSLSLEEKQEVLDQLVNEKLLYQAALKKGLDKDPKVQKVMVNTLLREVVYANVRNSDFTDEELQAFYEANKDEFVVPEKVQVKRILIKAGDKRPDEEAKAEAERILGEIKKDKKAFKDLAAKHSEDPYRRRGGDVGFVAKTGKPGLDPEVVNKAFELEVDAVSDVFKSSEGYNIVMVANKRDRVERTFQQMKGSVLRKVKNEKLKELYDAYVAQLRETADIKVDQDKLALVEVKSARRGAPGFTPPTPDADIKAPAAHGAPDDGGDDEDAADDEADGQ